MKRVSVFAVAVLFVALVSGNAFAAKASSAYKTEVDGMLSIATDPGDSFGSTLGLGVGVSFDMTDTFKPGTGRIFGRADINYFDWDHNDFGLDFHFTRVPIFLGGRYYVPTSGGNIDVFVEAGLELSFDREEWWNPFFGRVSSSDVHLGITPGVGIEVPISNDGFFIGGDARWHMIDHDYFTLSFVLGKKF